MEGGKKSINYYNYFNSHFRKDSNKGPVPSRVLAHTPVPILKRAWAILISNSYLTPAIC